MGDVYDTRGAAERERMAFWLDTVCEQMMPVQIDPRHDARPRAAMACNRLGAINLRRVAGGDHVYVRGERDIRRGDPDTIGIGMPRVGRSILVQDGRETVLHPGDVVIYDSSRPYTLAMEARFNWQVFLLPKSKLRRSDRELCALTAIRMAGGTGIVGVVHQFLSQLAADIDTLETDVTADALGENAADLIATLVHSQFGTPWEVGDPEAALRVQVRSFVIRNQADPHLDPTAIAAAHGISVRRLHQLYEGTGETVMDVLRQERLMGVRRDLSDPRLLDRSISQIARAHGLVNPTVFARQFRSQFGITARAFRSSVLGGVPRDVSVDELNQP
ncbi:helix-turn-helix domain-containing protein [Streptomyces sp. NPDC005373]|uniref:AraC-like ligand-binding domain-containing protein n=1 Tax=Streptomyces sp. NPDC005373 TaxID=3156879 RepID=UPI0033A2AF3F